MGGRRELVLGVGVEPLLGRGGCQEGGVPEEKLQEESVVALPFLWWAPLRSQCRLSKRTWCTM